MSEERMICPECGKEFSGCQYKSWPMGEKFTDLDHHYFMKHMPNNYNTSEIIEAGGTYEHYHLSMLGIKPCESQSVKHS